MNVVDGLPVALALLHTYFVERRVGQKRWGDAAFNACLFFFYMALVLA